METDRGDLWTLLFTSSHTLIYAPVFFVAIDAEELYRHIERSIYQQRHQGVSLGFWGHAEGSGHLPVNYSRSLFSLSQ